MAKDFSPEEKLLRLIRSKSPKQAHPEGAVSQGQAGGDVHKSVSIPVARKPHKDISIRPAQVLRLENLNLALILLLAGLLIFSVPFFLRKQKNTLEALEEKIKLQQGLSKGKAQDLQRPPFDYFSSEVGTRNIFQPILQEEAAGQTPVAEGPKLEDVKSQLSLLGIIGGDKPQAIIEDKKAQKTYFVNKGETFSDIEVKDILENKVVLSYKNQQFELVL